MFPNAFASAATFAPLGASLTRAVDVLRAIPDLSPAERMGAAFLLNRFAADRFAPGDPSLETSRVFLESVERTGGHSFDSEIAAVLERRWASIAEPEMSVADEEITGVIVRGPSFRAGPVRFYQDPFLERALEPGVVPAFGTTAGGYLVTNETHFSSYYPEVAGLGGVAVGIGSFQNLDLALAAEASGLVFCDLSPLVAMTLALLLPQLPLNADRFDFGRRAMELVRPGEEASRFLDPIPEKYRPAFAAHIDGLRESPDTMKSLPKFIKRQWNRTDSFLGNDALYERAADLARAGALSIAYGNFFGPGMAPVLDAALSVYADPLRIVHLTNAPEQLVVRNYDYDKNSLNAVLGHERADAEGCLLLSTEFTNRLDVRLAKRAANDQFSYHVQPLGSASRILRAYGGLRPFINRFRERIGLVSETG